MPYTPFVALQKHGVSEELIEWVRILYSCPKSRVQLQQVNGIELPRTSVFKYLGSAIAFDGGLLVEANSPVNAAWSKWRSLTGLLCDKKTVLTNCTFAKDEEDRGYYGMLVNGKRSDEAKNGEMKVELLCVGVGCDPVNISGLDYENDKYTMPFTPSSSDDLFLDGKYREGVKWTRTCSSGPVVGGYSL
ncbi:unnamed protein product [Heligmosomoides polygyrus]|uniref:SCP domain-containing protein n=1 Tax=Heligmosomoides polygyrus TaxID=6339 RepID=A0A183GLS0_HELPZ|nr:unnamed protein product [Heligmosomoides polygyrus]